LFCARDKTVNPVAASACFITKKHPIGKITTRIYYAGVDSIEVMVNGVSMGKSDFKLVI